MPGPEQLLRAAQAGVEVRKRAPWRAAAVRSRPEAMRGAAAGRPTASPLLKRQQCACTRHLRKRTFATRGRFGALSFEPCSLERPGAAAPTASPCPSRCRFLSSAAITDGGDASRGDARLSTIALSCRQRRWTPCTSRTHRDACDRADRVVGRKVRTSRKSTTAYRPVFSHGHPWRRCPGAPGILRGLRARRACEQRPSAWRPRAGS